jgi:hypothetical protein
LRFPRVANSVSNILRICDDSLLTIVCVFLSKSTGTCGHGCLKVSTKASVSIAYTGEEGSTQRGALRSVQTILTTSVGTSHTTSIQVAHGCAGAQCSQTHRCLQTRVGHHYSEVSTRACCLQTGVGNRTDFSLDPSRSYKSRMAVMPPAAVSGPQPSSLGSNTHPRSGSRRKRRTSMEMTSCRPSMALPSTARWHQGQLLAMYRWYLPASTGNLEPGSEDTKF